MITPRRTVSEIYCRAHGVGALNRKRVARVERKRNRARAVVYVFDFRRGNNVVQSHVVKIDFVGQGRIDDNVIAVAFAVEENVFAGAARKIISRIARAASQELFSLSRSIA